MELVTVDVPTYGCEDSELIGGQVPEVGSVELHSTRTITTPDEDEGRERKIRQTEAGRGRERS